MQSRLDEVGQERPHDAQEERLRERDGGGEEGKFKKIKVTLSNKINNIGVIRPRYAVKVDDFQKYETRFIPSRDFGLLIISTPDGVMTNRDAKEKKVGGRLIAYVY